MPRFSKENFPKNLELVDKLKAIGKKYNASVARVTLAWILAEHDHGNRNMLFSEQALLICAYLSDSDCWMPYGLSC